eukprot:CAMPEP_0172297084 /NCGR_PEP_ID=MMETSP1058-20130122/240_1 /TAXON_ID=83371 /ORGANISM="Detonula confervacea, Strain CCMP 353" /LENGTH=33 /DNA_ID= /DNA_START= /DNA_END= /DNA_ORIENTATION=
MSARWKMEKQLLRRSGEAFVIVTAASWVMVMLK